MNEVDEGREEGGSGGGGGVGIAVVGGEVGSGGADGDVTDAAACIGAETDDNAGAAGAAALSILISIFLYPESFS